MRKLSYRITSARSSALTMGRSSAVNGGHFKSERSSGGFTPTVLSPVLERELAPRSDSPEPTDYSDDVIR